MERSDTSSLKGKFMFVAYLQGMFYLNTIVKMKAVICPPSCTEIVMPHIDHVFPGAYHFLICLLAVAGHYTLDAICQASAFTYQK